MVQGLAHWMAFRNEMSNIPVIESDAVFAAIDLLRENLSCDYAVEREVSEKSLPIVGKGRIDLGIKSKQDGCFKCLIEFKLADATNKGYIGDVKKLSAIKAADSNIDCLVVILYRKSCIFSEPQEFINNDGLAKRGLVKVGKDRQLAVKVRNVCSSYASSKAQRSKKAICIEVM